MMINNISSILHNRDFSLHIRRVILANYFVDICRNKKTLELINSRQLETELKEDIITLYGRPYIATDSKIYDIVVATLKSIITNPENYEHNVIAAALISLAAYKDRSIIDTLESIILSLNDKIDDLYGPLAEYLINAISYSPTLIEVILQKLFLLTKNEKTYVIASKLMIDVTYKHYRLHPAYKNNSAFINSLTELNSYIRVEELKKIVPQLLSVCNVNAICILDWNLISKKIHYIAGANDCYRFKNSGIAVNFIDQFNIAITKTLPSITTWAEHGVDSVGMFELFSDDFKEIAIAPCAHFSNVNSLIVVLSKMPIDINTFIWAMICAKYIAGAVARLKEKLDVLRVYNKFMGDSHIIVRGLNHTYTSATAGMNASLSTLRKEAKLDSKNRERVDVCEKNVKLISDSIHNVMALVNFKYSSEVSDVGDIIDSVLTMLKIILRSDKVTIKRNYSSSCPRIAIPPGLHVVLMNLIDNARKALLNNPEDERFIAITTSYVNSNGAMIISITDNGHGISPDIANRIFEPFVSAFGGEGIGLTIAKDTMDKLGGELTSASLKQGTTFDVSWPARVITHET